MTTVTQERANLPGREDGEIVRDARPGGERGQLAVVELGHILERHVRFAGQGLEVARVRRAVVRRGVWGTHGHHVLFLRFEQATGVPLTLGHSRSQERHQRCDMLA
jgi:hypothetical protein